MPESLLDYKGGDITGNWTGVTPPGGAPPEGISAPSTSTLDYGGGDITGLWGAAPPEAPAPFDPSTDTGLPGEMYGRFTRDIFGTFASIPETMAAAGYYLDRRVFGATDKSWEEWQKGSALYQLGQGGRAVASAITPTESQRYHDHLAVEVSGGLGTVLGFIVGSKGLGAATKGTKAMQVAGAERMVGGALAKRGMAPKLAAQAVAKKGLTAPAIATATAKRAAWSETMGTLSTGVAMSTMEHWNDAYLNLMAKARAEGRTQLSDKELDQVFSAYLMGVPSGASEAMFGANRIAMNLFKKLDKGTGGEFSKGLWYYTKKGLAGAGEEAVQEMGQTAWLNMTAAEVAKYDENRKLFDQVARSGEVGGLVGGIVGLIAAGFGRKGNQYRQIEELRNERTKQLKAGNVKTADALTQKIHLMEMELSMGTEEAAAAQLRIDAEGEFINAVEKQRLAPFIKDMVVNEDGTVTIPMSDDFTMTTVDKSTPEEAAGITEPTGYDKVKMTIENEELKKKVDAAERAERDAQAAFDKDDSQDNLDDLGKAQQAVQDAQEAFDETPTIDIMRWWPKWAKESDFTVTSPDGKVSEPMSREEATKFIREQIEKGEAGVKREFQLIKKDIKEFGLATAVESWELTDKEIEALGYGEEWKKIKDIEPKEVAQRREADEAEEKKHLEREERVAEWDRRATAAGLTNTQRGFWGGGELVGLVKHPAAKQLGTWSAEIHELVKDGPAKASLGQPAVPEGSVLIKNLKTGELSVRKAEDIETREREKPLVTEPTEVVDAPELAPSKAAPQWTKNAVAVGKELGLLGVIVKNPKTGKLSVRKAEDNEEGYILYGGQVQPKKGEKRVSAEAVRIHHRNVAEMERVAAAEKEIREEVEKKLGPDRGKKVLALIDKLNQPKMLKERGGVKLTLDDVWAFMSIQNGIIAAENAAIAERLRERTEPKRKKFEKKQKIKLGREVYYLGKEHLTKTEEGEAIRRAERLMRFWEEKGLPPLFKVEEFKTKRVRRKTQKFDEKEITTKAVIETHKRLKQFLGPKKKKPDKVPTTGRAKHVKETVLTGRKRDGTELEDVTQEATVLTGTVNGIEYKVYQLKDGRVVTHKASTNEEWLTPGQAKDWMKDRTGNVGYVIEHDAADSELIGSIAAPLSEAQAGEAIEDIGAGKFRMTSVSQRIFKDSPQIKLSVSDVVEGKYQHIGLSVGDEVQKLKSAKVKAHEDMKSDAERMSSARTIILPDGTTSILQRSTRIGELAVPEAEVEVESEAERKAREKLEEGVVVSKGKKGAALKVTKTKGKDISVEGKKIVDAFKAEVVDLIAAGGRFFGVKVTNIHITETGKGKETEKPGDAVHVKLGDPTTIFINPKILGKYYVVVDGRLVSAAKREREKLQKALDALDETKDKAAIKKIEGQMELLRTKPQRSMESVAAEEVTHLQDLQVIHFVIDMWKKQGKSGPGGISNVSSYLKHIYNQLSQAQKEYITSTYMSKSARFKFTTPSATTQEAGRPTAKVEVKAKLEGVRMGEVQIAMEALRMLRSDGSHIFLETDQTAKNNSIFHSFFKGIRTFVRSKFNTLENIVEDEEGNRRQMPSAIRSHLALSERYLSIVQLQDGGEEIAKAGTFVSSEQAVELIYVKVGKNPPVTFDKTEEGYEYAEEYARRLIAKLPTKLERETTTVDNAIRNSDGNVFKGGFTASDKRSRKDFSRAAQDAQKIHILRQMKFTEEERKHIPDRYLGIGPHALKIPVDNWGDYVFMAASDEAERVFGGAGHKDRFGETQDAATAKAMEDYHSVVLPHLVTLARQRNPSLTKEEAEALPSVSVRITDADAFGLPVSAPDYYLHMFTVKAYDALMPNYTVKTSATKVGDGGMNVQSGKKFTTRKLAEDAAIEKHMVELYLKDLKSQRQLSPVLISTTITKKDRDAANRLVLKKDSEGNYAREYRLSKAEKKVALQRVWKEGRFSPALVPKRIEKKPEGKEKKRANPLRLEYAVGFAKHVYGAQQRDVMQRSGRAGVGMRVDEDGKSEFSEDAFAADVLALGDEMYLSYFESDTAHETAIHDWTNYHDNLDAIAEWGKDVAAVTFDTAEEAQAYIDSQEWVEKPDIITQGVAMEESTYEVQEVPGRIVTEETVPIGEEELTVFRRKQPAGPKIAAEAMEKKQKRTTFGKTPKPVTRQRTRARLVEVKSKEKKNIYITEGGKRERVMPQGLLLTNFEEAVIEKFFAAESASFEDRGTTRRFLHEVAEELSVPIDSVKEAVNSATLKMEQVNRIAEGHDERIGASLDEDPSTDRVDHSSPVADKGGFLRWVRPGDWSGLDQLERSGDPDQVKLAAAIRDFYDKEAALKGFLDTGPRVLRHGGYELAGVDKKGRKRSGMFFDTKEQAVEYQEDNKWKSYVTYTVEGYTKQQMKQAKAEFAEYFLVRERALGNKEQNEAIAKFFLKEKTSKATQALVRWQMNIGTVTGDMMKESKVQVYKDGKWVDMSIMGHEHFPRVFKQRTWEILNNPTAHPDEYSEMQDAMVKGGFSKDRKAAHLKLQSLMSQVNTLSESEGDYFAAMEKARKMKLPEQFYDTSFEAYGGYLNRFSTRMAQIQAFGQGRGKEGPRNMFDVVADSMGGEKGRKYIERLKRAVYRTYSKDDPIKLMLTKIGLPVTAITYLSGPLTALRNTSFALRANAEHFGTINTFVASGRALMNVVKTHTESLKKKGEMGQPDFYGHADSLGLIHGDWVAGRQYAILDDDVTYGAEQRYKEAVTSAQKVALWMQRTTEQFNRSITAAMSLQHLRRTHELLDTDPESKAAAKHVAMITRLGYTPEQINKLFQKDKKGHWKPDREALDKFIRDMVYEKQYSYNITQHPLWMEHPSSRILFQFQKWGYQRARDLAKNVWRPFFRGTTVTMPDGTVKKVRDIAPLVRNLFLMMGQGTLYASLLRGLFYDRERDEMVIPMSEKQENLWLAYSEVIQMNMVYDGGFGIIGDYYSMLNPLDVRAMKWKDPFNPPAINLAEDTWTMVKDIKHILGEDTNTSAKGTAVVAAVERTIAGLPFIKAFGALPLVGPIRGGLEFNARRLLGIDSYELRVQDGKKDTRLVRAAARRFAAARGYEDERVWSGGTTVITEKRALYHDLNEALLAGDKVKAREVRDRLVAGARGKERKSILAGIKSSVRSRQPILLEGKQPTSKVQREFLRWVKKEVPEHEERIDRINKLYWQTARRAGVK